jgi:nucleoside-diphosphate-sugar epimerase
VKENTQNSVVAITGAHGFIGKHLIEKLLERNDVSVRALVRNSPPLFEQRHGLTEIQGDLLKSETLSSFLLPGCTVINLAYGFDLTNIENIHAAKNLIEICKKKRIKRLIHCSTASVFGSNQEKIVNEESTCTPKTEYGHTKLLIEQLLQDGARGHFEFVNMRPTSVFGVGGAALTKLIFDLRNRNMLINYLKSCFFNKRKLNLVSVETVVAAILFIFDDKVQDVDGQTFIISEDDESINNFEYVEKYLLHELYGRYYFLPPIKLPLIILSLILLVRGRDAHNPLRIYDSSKIRKFGFNPPRPLTLSLTDFVQWKIKQNESS